MGSSNTSWHLNGAGGILTGPYLYVQSYKQLMTAERGRLSLS